MNTSFTIDYWTLPLLAILGLIFFFLMRLRQRFEKPHLLISSLPLQTVIKPISTLSRLRYFLILLPLIFLYSALILFAISLMNPQLHSPYENNDPHEPPHEGIAIFLVLDQSGSMKEEIFLKSLSGNPYQTSKIDALKQTSQQFILGDKSIGLEGRMNDMIGLMFFARGAKIMAPLTLDHQSVIDELSAFNAVNNKDQDGTAIGYALYKTAELIRATKHYAKQGKDKNIGYSIKSYVIILMTDGLQDPNPLDAGKRLRNIDIPEAADYLKQQNIKLYVINVEPNMSTDHNLPFQHIMQQAAQLTGGNYFTVDENIGLEKIYRDIDQLEKSSLPQMPKKQAIDRPVYKKILLFPYFLSLGLILYFLAIFLETWPLRRLP